MKNKSDKNNVHFYVARDKYGELYLYMGKPTRTSDEFDPCNGGKAIGSSRKFTQYGLNKNDYVDLKWEDEPIEVFVNMKE